jgi:hypothetical protein
MRIIKGISCGKLFHIIEFANSFFAPIEIQILDLQSSHFDG